MSDEQKLQSVTDKNTVRDLRLKKYFAFEDFPDGRTRKFKIKDVGFGKVPAKIKNEKTGKTEWGEKVESLMTFEGTSRVLILCDEKMAPLQKKSKKPIEWKGIEVELYADPNVKFGPRKVGGVRLRVVK